MNIYYTEGEEYEPILAPFIIRRTHKGAVKEKTPNRYLPALSVRPEVTREVKPCIPQQCSLKGQLVYLQNKINEHLDKKPKRKSRYD